MPLVEVIARAVAAKVLDYLADQAIDAGGTAIATRARTWLGRNAQSVAMETALVRAETRFAKRYPQVHATRFDRTFLVGQAAPLLARALTRTESATGAELAHA